MLRFRRMRSLQKFASVHASVSNHFNSERCFSSRLLFKANRAAALAEWRGYLRGTRGGATIEAETVSHSYDTTPKRPFLRRRIDPC